MASRALVNHNVMVYTLRMNYDPILEKKKQLDTFRPLPKALVSNLEEWFQVELTYTSNALEGNTLTRQETALVVEKGLTVGGKSLKEHLEATNHSHALDWVKARVSKQKSKAITLNDILQIHSVILKGIDDENAGFLRQVPVRIAGSTMILPNHHKVPLLLEKFIRELALQETNPIQTATWAHYELVTIHPFIDGNGRTARLLMNMILMMHGFPPAIIRMEERLKYLSALEKAQLGGLRSDFDQLIAAAVERSLDIYLRATQGKESSDLLESQDRSLLKIGELAKQTGLVNSTIRHWTKLGLISVARTTQSGYQLYDKQTLLVIQKILALKEKRFTLNEIKNQLAGRNS